MTFEDRGGARLTKLLTDPERAKRVFHIRQQMREDDRARREPPSARPSLHSGELGEDQGMSLSE
jgi:hypothetical protein